MTSNNAQGAQNETLPAEPAESLARFIVATRYQDIPETVTEYTKKSILDTLAVTIGGSSQAGIDAFVDLARSAGGTPEATILIHGGKVPATSAAFANGPQARAMDMGDVHEEGGHVGEYILPSLLAAAELRDKRGQAVTGQEFITAYAVGGEILARTGNATFAISANQTQHAGRHCQFGGIGATAAVAKLLRLSEEQTWHALGIAYITASSYDGQMYLEGSLMCRGHHANVCRDAVAAVLLAEKGITGTKKIFTGKPCNFFSLYFPAKNDIRRLTDGLGSIWESGIGTMIKLYMGCKCFHSHVYATLCLIEENGIDLLSIQKISLRVDPTAVWGYTPEKYQPQSMIDCQFSGAWMVATGAIDGHIFLDSYQNLWRDDVRALMPKIEAVADQSVPTWAVIATIEANGAQYTKRVDHVLGHPKNMVSWDWLENKLHLCAKYSAVKMSEGKLKQLVALCRSLDHATDATAIVGLMT